MNWAQFSQNPGCDDQQQYPFPFFNGFFVDYTNLDRHQRLLLQFGSRFKKVGQDFTKTSLEIYSRILSGTRPGISPTIFLGFSPSIILKFHPKIPPGVPQRMLSGFFYKKFWFYPEMLKAEFQKAENPKGRKYRMPENTGKQNVHSASR